MVSYNVKLHEEEAPPGGTSHSSKTGDEWDRSNKTAYNWSASKPNSQSSIGKWTTQQRDPAGKQVLDHSKAFANTNDMQLPMEKSGFDRLDTLVNLSVIHKKRAGDIGKTLIKIGQLTVQAGLKMTQTHVDSSATRNQGRNANDIGRRLIAIGHKIHARGERVLKTAVVAHMAKPTRKQGKNRARNHITKKGAVQPVTPSIKMVPLCSHGQTHHDVTLLGGFHAGKYIAHGKVDNMRACIKTCCAIHTCNVAFMVREECYSVTCTHTALCSHVRAHNAQKYNPQLVYIWRKSPRGRKMHGRSLKSHKTRRQRHYGSHAIHGKRQRSDRHTKWTETRITSGVQRHRSVPSENAPVGVRWQGPKVKNLPITRSKTKALTSQSSRHAIVNGMVKEKVKTKPGAKIPYGHSLKPRHMTKSRRTKVAHAMTAKRSRGKNSRSRAGAVLCPRTAVETNVSLPAGVKTGNFSYVGEVSNVEECVKVCCLASNCDMAFMLNQSCYTVQCADESVCETTPNLLGNYRTKAVRITKRFKPVGLKSRNIIIKKASADRGSDRGDYKPKVSKHHISVSSTHSEIQGTNLVKSESPAMMRNPTDPSPFYVDSSINKRKQRTSPRKNQVSQILKILEEKIYKLEHSDDSAVTSGSEDIIGDMDQENFSEGTVNPSPSTSDPVASALGLHHENWRSSARQGEPLKNQRSRARKKVGIVVSAINANNTKTFEQGGVVESEKDPGFEQSKGGAIARGIQPSERDLLPKVTATSSVSTTGSSSGDTSRTDKLAHLSLIIKFSPTIVRQLVHTTVSHESSAQNIGGRDSMLTSERDITTRDGLRNPLKWDSLDKSSREQLPPGMASRNMPAMKVSMSQDLSGSGEEMDNDGRKLSAQEEQMPHSTNQDDNLAVDSLIGKPFYQTSGEGKVSSYGEEFGFASGMDFTDVESSALSGSGAFGSASDETISSPTLGISSGQNIASKVYQIPQESAIPLNNSGQLCISREHFVNATLRGGFGAGNFTFAAKVNSPQDCVSLCCDSEFCDLGFVISNRCFLVRCFEKVLCDAIPAMHPLNYNPHIYYISRTNNSSKVQDPNKGTSLSRNTSFTNKSNTDRSTDKYYIAINLAPQIPESEMQTTKTNSSSIQQAQALIGHRPGFASNESKAIASRDNSSPALPTRLNTAPLTPTSVPVTPSYSPSTVQQEQNKLKAIESIGDSSIIINFEPQPERGAASGITSGSEQGDTSSSFSGSIASGLESVVETRNDSVAGEAEDQQTLPTGRRRFVGERIVVKVPDELVESVRNNVDYNDTEEHRQNITREAQQRLCSAGQTIRDVSFKHGRLSGNFTELGHLQNISDCASRCCQSESCDVAFMLGKNCYSVQCFSKQSCETVIIHGSHFNPSMVFVYRDIATSRTNEVRAENSTSPRRLHNTSDLQSRVLQTPKASVGVIKKGRDQTKDDFSERTHPCRFSQVFNEVALRGGSQAGNFNFVQDVYDIRSCKEKCCDQDMCDLVLMLRQNCFLVTCRDTKNCESIAATPSEYHPRIAYKLTRGPGKCIAV